MYRAALIGCGKIGSAFADDPRVPSIYSHAGAYDACPSTRLIAVCDTDSEVARRCAHRWGVQDWYCDARELLTAQRPEIVSVCTPDQTHYDLIHLVLGAPSVRAVFAEKPLAMELTQAEDLVGLAEARGLALAVNYFRRYAATHIEIAALVRSGGIGDIVSLGGVYTNGTLHNGTHWFDLARFIAGDIEEVWGCDARREAGMDPTLDAFIRFSNGATGHLRAGNASAYSVFEMDILGTQGRVRILDSGHRIETARVADIPHYSGYRTLVADRQSDAGMGDVALRAVEDLVRCLEEGGAPRCSGEDAVAALRVACAARDSARSGKPVRLNPRPIG
jgi:predicted dehydrogenase